MIAWLIILILLTSILAVFEKNEEDKTKVYFFYALAALLVLTACMREVGFDRDSKNYEAYFLHKGTLSDIIVEPTYLLICEICRLFSDDVHSVFFIYAVFGVGLKFYAIKKYSTVLFLPVVIYLGNYFLLQEMTQIRAGVATGMLLLMIKPLAEGKKKQALLINIGAILIHYSAFVMLPLLFINNKEMSKNWKIIWLSIIPFAYFLHFAHIGLTTLPIPVLQNKIEIYTEMRDRGIMGDEVIKVFNPLLLVQIAIYYYLFYMSDTVEKFNKYFILLIKIYGISIFTFLFFADIPVICHRISEIFGIVTVILYSEIAHTIKPELISRSLVAFIGLAWFAFNVFYAELFD